jgi:hypothetical protein
MTGNDQWQYQYVMEAKGIFGTDIPWRRIYPFSLERLSHHITTKLDTLMWSL